MAHKRNFVEAKTTLLFAQGNTLIDTALEKGTESYIMFSICSIPNDHIIMDAAADSLKTFKSLM